MLWNEKYDQDNQPTLKDMNNFVTGELFNELCTFVEDTYKIPPKIEYSVCSAQKGWNVKFKKSGKSLCILYPMENYFIVLVVIGAKEQTETEFMIGTCSKYVQKLFAETPFSCGGRWLMINVKDEQILDDVKKLVDIRTRKR